MKNRVQRSRVIPGYIVALSTLCLLVSIVPFSAQAASKDSFRVGVLDPQAVIEKSKAGGRALATLKEHAQARENILKSDQKELERMQEELKASEGKGSDAEQKQKQERFAQKFQEWQKRGQEYQVELSQKQKDLVMEYMKKIEEATQAVATRHGFDLVVDKGSENTLKIILFSRDGLDLTNEVVKEFDRRFK
ncbi:MAG: OmpH family outer membrane protein [Nitrospirales bacterium]|nr:OmpH family outer membrane protein [Nitrospirales bacterium]